MTLLRLMLCLVAGCLHALPESAHAEVIEKIEYRYYDAQARAGLSLLEILDTASPIRDGGVFHGYTRWDLNWRYRYDARGDGRCRITQVSVDLASTVQLPRLNGGTDAQRQAFEVYLKALREHELGHVRIGREAAQAVERRIFILPEMESCAALDRAAGQTAQKTLAEHQAREREYDRSTQHGKTQGAWLDR